MRGLSGLSDFLLRKAFKFALKRNLGKYLTSEIDPSQLDVQLGQGTIELRQLLLNCNELNEQLVSTWGCLLYANSAFAVANLSSLHSRYCTCSSNAQGNWILLYCSNAQKKHPAARSCKIELTQKDYCLPAELPILGNHCWFHRQRESHCPHYNTQH